MFPIDGHIDRVELVSEVFVLEECFVSDHIPDIICHERVQVGVDGLGWVFSQATVFGIKILLRAILLIHDKFVVQNLQQLHIVTDSSIREYDFVVGFQTFDVNENLGDHCKNDDEEHENHDDGNDSQERIVQFVTSLESRVQFLEYSPNREISCLAFGARRTAILK